MAVTLSNGSATFTFNDGNVDTVDIDLTAEIDVIPAPGSEADESFLSDINGAMKKIVLRGSLTEATSTRVSGSSILTIAEQKGWLEALINGMQSAVPFTSTFESCTVMIEKMTFTEQAGEPETLPFTINLVVGTG